MSTVTPDQEVRRAAGPIFGARLVSNLSLRLVYPFLPAIARGLGVSLEAAGTAVAVRDLTGLAGPAAGRLADRTGSRSRMTMLATLGALAACTLLSGATGSLVWFTVAMAGVALLQMTFQILTMTWLAHRVPYRRRGRVFGLIELSWAGAFLVGVPIVGFIIDRWGWQAPFPIVAGLILVAAAALRVALPHDDRGSPYGTDAETGAPATWTRPERRRHPDSVMVFVAVATMTISVQLVIVTYGAWFEDSFGFTVAAVGLATILVGTSELAGSAGTAVLSDRFGKRRTILGGLAVMVPAAALLGTVGDTTLYGLALVALVIVGFELAFVTSLVLMAELDTSARGEAMGVGGAVATVGRAAGSLIGTVAYTQSGIALTGLLAAGIAAVGGAILLTRVTEPEG